MSNQNSAPQSILLHIAAEDIPAGEIDLWPGLREDLVRSKPFNQRGNSSMSTKMNTAKRFQLALGAGLVTIFAVAFLLFTNPGKAFAQQVLGYFIPASQTGHPVPALNLTAQAMPEEQRPTSAPTAIPAATHDCPPPAEGETAQQSQYGCDVAYLQAEMGAWVKVLPFDYGHLEYRAFDIYNLPSSPTAILRIVYGPAPDGAIAVLQGQGDFPPTLSEDGSDDYYSEVPSEAIQPVTVNGQPGEYVEGGFAQMGGSDQYTWTDEIPIVRLRWKEGDTWIEITRFGVPELYRDVLGSRENLLALAEALIPVTEVAGQQP